MLKGEFGFDDEVEPSSATISKFRKNPGLLSCDTVHITNLVFKSLIPKDPGVIIQLGDKRHIHAALSLPSSPFGPGHTQEASRTMFRNWIVGRVYADPDITNARRVQGPNSLAWHHLNDSEAFELLFHRLLVPAWLVDIRAANYPQHVAIVLIATGSGRGSSNLAEVGIFD
jgi:hypothetical protein